MEQVIDVVEESFEEVVQVAELSLEQLAQVGGGSGASLEY
jgi:hypothetical protein